MIPAVKGTRDILPREVSYWQHVENTARSVCERYGYVELRTPLIEREELFTKGTGVSTDIVQKEMYTFIDKGSERVTLRPEATPGMVRAFVEHGLEQTLVIPKLYCLGPMFRYERPQKGRYRQFHQLNVEVFGVKDPAIDAELIEMASRLIQELGIEPADLIINSVGCPTCRPVFSKALMVALRDDVENLCGDCQRRMQTNPLRILDCKNPSDQTIIDRLPHAVDFLCGACLEHFEAVKHCLHTYDLSYRVSHRLVRGLDYYTRTTFEILNSSLGAQNALLGGGRYDGLIKLLGGPSRAGIGFAAGLERLVLALPGKEIDAEGPDVFVVAIGDEAREATLVLVRDLRKAGLRVQIDYDGRTVKSQMKRANRLRARKAVILGSDELARNEVRIRDMTNGDQFSIPREQVIKALCESRESVGGTDS